MSAPTLKFLARASSVSRQAVQNAAQAATPKTPRTPRTPCTPSQVTPRFFSSLQVAAAFPGITAQPGVSKALASSPVPTSSACSELLSQQAAAAQEFFLARQARIAERQASRNARPAFADQVGAKHPVLLGRASCSSQEASLQRPKPRARVRFSEDCCDKSADSSSNAPSDAKLPHVVAHQAFCARQARIAERYAVKECFVI